MEFVFARRYFEDIYSPLAGCNNGDGTSVLLLSLLLLYQAAPEAADDASNKQVRRVRVMFM